MARLSFHIEVAVAVGREYGVVDTAGEGESVGAVCDGDFGEACDGVAEGYIVVAGLEGAGEDDYGIAVGVDPCLHGELAGG